MPCATFAERGMAGQELTRRALAGAALALATAAPALAAPSADAEFDALSRRWLAGMLRRDPVAATLIGAHQHDRRLTDVSAAGRARRRDAAQALRGALARIDRGALSRERQVDAAILANDLSAQIFAHDQLQDWRWDPLIYQNSAGDALYALAARAFAPLSARLAAAQARMRAVPRFFADVRAALDPARVPAIHAEVYAAQNQGLVSLADDMLGVHADALAPYARERFRQALATFRQEVEAHQRWIEASLVPAAQGDDRIGATLFDQKLAFTLHGQIERADIRRRAEAAVRVVRERMYQLAQRALAGRADAPALPAGPDPEQEQNAIAAALELAAAARPPRGGLVEAAEQGLAEAERFVREKDLMTLAPDPVRVILMPEFRRGVSVAYCDSPGPLEADLDTFYAVSPIPDDWSDTQAASFLREYNRYMIGDIAVHDAMPGHYVQIAHARNHPSALRSVLASGAFVEGWAVYAEAMMVEAGFHADDPLYELTQLKVLLRTITNAILDQAVHVDGVSREAAMALMMRTAFQEEREAAGKWTRARVSSTQLSTYFVGYEEHMAARAAAQAQWGSAFTLKRYHDGLLAFGSPPVAHARALLLDEPIPKTRAAP
jgi:uncharacterized protein (DUF885 family)